MAKNENAFDCFKSGCRMHVKKQCKYLNENAIKGVMAPGKTPSWCVTQVWMTSHPTNSSRNQKRKASRTTNYKRLRKKWLTWKTLSMKPKLSWPKTNLQTRQTIRSFTVQNRPSLPKTTWTEFQSEESPNIWMMTLAAGRNHDFYELQKIVGHVNVEQAISDVTRLSNRDTNKTRSILFNVPNPSGDGWFHYRETFRNRVAIFWNARPTEPPPTWKRSRMQEPGPYQETRTVTAMCKHKKPKSTRWWIKHSWRHRKYTWWRKR